MGDIRGFWEVDDLKKAIKKKKMNDTIKQLNKIELGGKRTGWDYVMEDGKAVIQKLDSEEMKKLLKCVLYQEQNGALHGLLKAGDDIAREGNEKTWDQFKGILKEAISELGNDLEDQKRKSILKYEIEKNRLSATKLLYSLGLGIGKNNVDLLQEIVDYGGLPKDTFDKMKEFLEDYKGKNEKKTELSEFQADLAKTEDVGIVSNLNRSYSESDLSEKSKDNEVSNLHRSIPVQDLSAGSNNNEEKIKESIVSIVHSSKPMPDESKETSLGKVIDKLSLGNESISSIPVMAKKMNERKAQIGEIIEALGDEVKGASEINIIIDGDKLSVQIKKGEIVTEKKLSVDNDGKIKMGEVVKNTDISKDYKKIYSASLDNVKQKSNIEEISKSTEKLNENNNIQPPDGRSRGNISQGKETVVGKEQL